MEDYRADAKRKLTWKQKLLIGLLTALLGSLFTNLGHDIYSIVKKILIGPGGPSPEIAFFHREPPSIAASGKAILSWQCTDAIRCNLEWGKGNKRESLPIKHEYKVSPKTTTTYTLIAIAKNGKAVKEQVTVEVLSAASTRKGRWQEYVAVLNIMEELDCDIDNLDNHQKELRFTENFRGKRVVLTKTVQKVDVENSRLFLSPDGEMGVATIPGAAGLAEQLIQFNEPVELRFESQHGVFSTIRSGQKIMLDCLVSTYCRDGWIFDQEMVLSDCQIKNKSPIEGRP